MTLACASVRFALLVVLCLAAFASAGTSPAERATVAPDCPGVVDAHGHGPDPGSEEWWTACHFQLLKGVWLRALGDGRVFAGYRFGPARRLDLVNLFPATGRTWQLADRTTLDLSFARGSARFRIVEISRDVLRLARTGDDDGRIQRYRRPPQRLPADAWIGRWVARDGDFLELLPRGANGGDGWDSGYRVVIGGPAGVAAFAGDAVADGVRFGAAERQRWLTAATGDTGSWPRKECLWLDRSVRYCRDAWPE